MHIQMYEMFLKEYFDLKINKIDNSFVGEGFLVNRVTNKSIKIENYIPRFCQNNYNESFSFQWHKFKDLQLDSKNNYSHSYERIIKNTKWDLDSLKDATILECGSGPGRFTEVFLRTGAKVVSVDMSKAVDVNFENNSFKKNLLLLQSDITKMPFFYNKFDYVFCYGVLQHTPNPKKTFENLIKYVKPEGKISVDIYRKTFIPVWWSTPKYLWRPITKNMNKEKLLKIISWYIPKYIDIDTKIRRIPYLGKGLLGLIPIPCWNYINRGYNKQERIQHAIMDTFDALSPAYDKPKTLRKIKKLFKNHQELYDIDIFYGSNGIVGNARKK